MDETVNYYEIGYLFSPLVPENLLPEKINGQIREPLVKAGGEMVSEQVAKLIPLAYRIRKTVNRKNTIFDRAYFGAMIFKCSAQALSGIKKQLTAADDLVRFLILKHRPISVQSLLRRQIKSTSVAEPERSSAPPVVTPEGLEAIDRKIDDLLVPSHPSQ